MSVLTIKISSGQTTNPQITLKIKDFAVWGGSASPQVYNNAQGVTLGRNASIQGKVGNNHKFNTGNVLILAGNIYSGNS